MTNIIYIESDKMIREACKQFLEKIGYSVEVFSDASSAYDNIKEENRWSLGIIDLSNLGDFEFIARLKQKDNAFPIISTCSPPCSRIGNLATDTCKDAVEKNRFCGYSSGSDLHLLKPFGLGELEEMIQALIHITKIKRELIREY